MTLDRVKSVANEVATQVVIVCVSLVCPYLINRALLCSLSFLMLVNVGSERLFKLIGQGLKISFDLEKFKHGLLGV